MKSLVFHIVYMFLSLGVFLSASICCYYWTQDSQNMLTYPTSFMNQVT